MARNDFRAAGDLRHYDYVLTWPQSNERIRGRENFVSINEAYPAAGQSQFTVNRLVGQDDAVVTDVTATDGVQTARAITFSEIRDGQITRHTEHGPDPCEACAAGGAGGVNG